MVKKGTKILEEVTERNLKKIWVVTTQDGEEEPVITVFDNEKEGQYCYNYFKKEHDKCYLDQTYLYKKFFILRGVW